MTGFIAAALASLLVVVLSGRRSEAATHVFRIGREQAYNGMLRSDIPPALEIDDGDTVVCNTEMLFEGTLDADMTIDDVLAIRGAIKSKGGGTYAFTGPFFVRGARPGDVLGVRIKRISPGAFGVTYVYPDALGLGGLPEGMGAGFFRTLRYSPDRKTVDFAPGITLTLRPFLGAMAVAPKPGEVRQPAIPDYFAGNMDNRELVAGSSLFVPVNVEGALFMAADAHGLQGDGEVSCLACETYFEEVELEFVVRRDMTLERPMAETPTHWIVMGFHADLDEAMKIAISDAIAFLMAAKGLTRTEAYALCSLAVDFRVTQVVDGNKGIHGMIPKAIFRQA